MTSSMVEEIVKWRMGSAYDSPILNWRDRRLNFNNASALFFDNAGAITIDESGPFLCTAPGRQNYNPLKRPRLIEIGTRLPPERVRLRRVAEAPRQERQHLRDDRRIRRRRGSVVEVDHA